MGFEDQFVDAHGDTAANRGSRRGRSEVISTTGARTTSPAPAETTTKTTPAATTTLPTSTAL